MSRRPRKKGHKISVEHMFSHTRERIQSNVHDTSSSLRFIQNMKSKKKGIAKIREEESNRQNEIFAMARFFGDKDVIEEEQKSFTSTSSKKDSRVTELGKHLTDMDGLIEAAKNRFNKKKQSKDMEEEDESTQKKQKRKRFRPVMVQIQDSVDKNLKTLSDNPDKLRKLKRQIEKYESQNTKFGKKVKKKKAIRDNIRNIRNYSTKERNRRSGFQERRAVLRNLCHLNREEENEIFRRRTEKTKQSNEEKTRNAENHKEMFHLRLVEMEKRQKWSFVVSLFSRVYLMYNTLERKREQEFETKRRRELTSIVYQRMMPIVREERHKEWVRSWIKFKKHWYFYRLWLHVAKKKRATFIIKTFLKSAGIDYSFVKKVNSFRSNIKKCQYYVSKFNRVAECRIMLNTFRYTIIESRMILDRNVLSKKKRFVSKQSGGSTPLTSRSEKNLVSTSSSNKEKRNEFLEVYVKPMNSGPICQLRPSLEERLEIVKVFLKERKEKFLRDYPIYESQLLDYNERLQQQEFMEKAHSLLKLQEESDDETSDNESLRGLDKSLKIKTKKKEEKRYLYSEGGKIIPEPKKPFFRVFITEKEMEGLVKKGFKSIREKEEKVFREVSKAGLAGTSLIERLDEIKLEYQKNDLFLMNALKRHYEGDKTFDDRKKLFKQANDIVDYIRKQRYHVHACESNMKRKKK